MGLDFTALNNIPSYTAGNLAKQLAQAGTGNNEHPSGAINRLERQRKEREHTRQMYTEYQQNIRQAGTTREDILKGLRAGEDPRAILLKALECISLMTGDAVIYAQGKKDLLAIYGWGVQTEGAKHDKS